MTMQFEPQILFLITKGKFNALTMLAIQIRSVHVTTLVIKPDISVVHVQ